MSKVKKISLSSKVKKNLRESTLWVTGAIGLILFLALSTYDIDDPGFSYVGNESQIILEDRWCSKAQLSVVLGSCSDPVLDIICF